MSIVIIDGVENKRCWRCKKTKDINSFNKNKGKIDGLQDLCKSCQKETQHISRKNHPEKEKKWHATYVKNHPEKVKASRAKYKKQHADELKTWNAAYKKLPAKKEMAAQTTARHVYNIDKLELLKQQKYLCGNLECLNPEITMSAHVDHDHSCCPGKTSCGSCVRGLLCKICHLGQSQLKDSPKLLRGQAEFIERYEAKKETEKQLKETQ